MTGARTPCSAPAGDAPGRSLLGGRSPPSYFPLPSGFFKPLSYLGRGLPFKTNVPSPFSSHRKMGFLDSVLSLRPLGPVKGSSLPKRPCPPPRKELFLAQGMEERLTPRNPPPFPGEDSCSLRVHRVDPPPVRHLPERVTWATETSQGTREGAGKPWGARRPRREPTYCWTQHATEASPRTQEKLTGLLFTCFTVWKGSPFESNTTDGTNPFWLLKVLPGATGRDHDRPLGV